MSSGAIDRQLRKELPAAQDLNADQLSCAAWIARFLKARGVDRVFGLQGGCADTVRGRLISRNGRYDQGKPIGEIAAVAV
jgi:hypothetical protein